MNQPPTVVQRRRAPKMVGEPGKIVRRYTFNALALVASFQAASLMWGFLPPAWVQWLTLVIALAGAFGAFVDQPDTR
jgi:hypothetical protein